MKITELQKLENEQIANLRRMSMEGNTDAARVLLEHLRCVSKAITEWKKDKDRDEQSAK